MAITPTVFDEYRLMYEKSKLDVAEHRLGNFGSFEVVRNDTPNLVPGYQDLVVNKHYEDQTVSIPVIQRHSWSAGTSRSCTAETNDSTSAFVDTSWSTFKLGFTMIPALYKSNFVSYQQDFNVKMKSIERIALETLNAAAETMLNTYKSAYDATNDYPYSWDSGVFTVPAADGPDFFNFAQSILLANKLEANDIKLTGSPMLKGLASKWSAQGAGNATNLAYQFGPWSMAWSNTLSVATSDIATAYFFPAGTCGYLSWVDADSELGHTSGDGKEWRKEYMPLLGHEVGVLMQSTCGDKSSTQSGKEATLVESFSFSFDYAFLYAYASAPSTQSRPIFKAAFSKS